MSTEVRIQIKEDALPFVQAVPRRIAAARKQPLYEVLCRMEKLGVIKQVERPTEWCSPCVIVLKRDGTIRVCVDFTRLNKAVKREYYSLLTSDETLSELGNARIFSKLDANCGYWQMKLHPDSYHFTTFINPFGRYWCKRLPFGISSAPEIFQREMKKVFVGLPGTVRQMDDILIYTRNQREHDDQLEQVLKKFQESEITLNVEKCKFRKTELRFLGHIIGAEGIKADPEKTMAVTKFPTLCNRRELRKFFGMGNYMVKFSAAIAENSGKLRQLLGNNSD